MMNENITRNVTCDKCGHDFAINQADFEGIRKGDIIVQYFRCPACLARYHVSTTNSEMRKLIKERLEIQNRIAGYREKPLPVGTTYKLKHRLDKVITRQKKLIPDLKKRGEKILKESENE